MRKLIHQIWSHVTAGSMIENWRDDLKGRSSADCKQEGTPESAVIQRDFIARAMISCSHVVQRQLRLFVAVVGYEELTDQRDSQSEREPQDILHERGPVFDAVMDHVGFRLLR